LLAIDHHFFPEFDDFFLEEPITNLVVHLHFPSYLHIVMVVSHIFLQNGKTITDTEFFAEHDGSHIVFLLRFEVLLLLPLLGRACDGKKRILEKDVAEFRTNWHL
jgi:hypothetical protein